MECSFVYCSGFVVEFKARLISLDSRKCYQDSSDLLRGKKIQTVRTRVFALIRMSARFCSNVEYTKENA